MPKSKKEIWPFVATYTTLKPISLYGLASRKSPIIHKPNEPNFVWLICASGFFAIPLDRDSVRSITEARDFIQERIEQEKARGGKFGMMVGYEANNNS